MRRAIVTSTATVSGIVLLIGLKSHPAGASPGAAKTISSGGDPGPVATSSAPAAGGTSGGSSTGGSTSGPTAAPTTKAAAGSGSTATRVVTGTAADTRYGPVQLQVTFAGKKITKIDVIQYPTESGRDQEINQYALPVLNQEAIAAQSAKIDAVSGATYTSDGYATSLQSAIDQAGA